MLVLKSTLQRIQKENEDSRKRENELTNTIILQLQSQIEDLRKLVFVSAPTPIETLPIREANAIIDGQEVMPQADEELEAEMREVNLIMSGEYDNSGEMFN